MRSKFREEERDKRKREERRDGDGDGGGAVGVGNGPRKLRCGHSTVNCCKLRYSVQSPASPESCDLLYNHVNVTLTACRFRSEVACRCLHLPIRLVFLVFFLLYSTRQTPRCFRKLLLLKSRLLNFCSSFALSASFFFFFWFFFWFILQPQSRLPCHHVSGHWVIQYQAPPRGM